MTEVAQARIIKDNSDMIKATGSDWISRMFLVLAVQHIKRQNKWEGKLVEKTYLTPYAFARIC